MKPAPLHYALALHTTTPDLGLALGPWEREKSDPEQRRFVVLPLGREMAATLHQHLQTFLEPQVWSDLKCLAVAKGPGGFTGTRLGLVTARTIAQQLDLPLFALSTLETLALHHALRDHHAALGTWTHTVAVSLPAQRGQLFGAIYRCFADRPPEAIVLDDVYEPTAWQSTLERHGPDQVLTLTATDPLAHSVETLLDLAQGYWHLEDPSLSRPHWLQALPFYGQHPAVLETHK